MTHDFSIRPALATDIPVIHEIYSFQVLTGIASWELTPPSPEELQRRMNNLREQGYPYFVAEDQGVVIGYTYASSFRSRGGYRYTVEDSIYVHPDNQRRAVGGRMLAHLIKACEGRGYRQMIAVIADTANSASIRLHQKLGFVHIGILPHIGFKQGRWLDCLLMQRSLGEGEKSLPD